MLGVLARHHQPTLAADNFAIAADGFYGSSDFHKSPTNYELRTNIRISLSFLIRIFVLIRIRSHLVFIK